MTETACPARATSEPCSCRTRYGVALRFVSPAAAIHPGEFLADELAELGITPTELARQINVPANRVTQIIRGRRGITGDTALRLGHWFGISAEFWLNLQAAFELRVAAQEAGATIDALPVRPGLVPPAPGHGSRVPGR